jgi:hypothetical protein
MVSDRQAVLKTLKYSDLFDCPQTEAEISKFLIKKIEKKELKKILSSSPEISFNSGYYSLKGREKTIELRKKREQESLLKIEKAKKIVSLLSKIPTIMLLGISGSVAVRNAKKDDDIDLFIVTYKNTLWITRFLMIVLLKFLRVYRSRGEKDIKDKFCLNMFSTEETMVFKEDKRNLFTAREVSQLVPIFQRENSYSNFIEKNNWIKEYLPNVLSFLKKENGKLVNNKKFMLSNRILSILEIPARSAQIKRIKRRMTKETVSYNFVAFHPKDVMSETLSKYKNSLE